MVQLALALVMSVASFDAEVAAATRSYRDAEFEEALRHLELATPLASSDAARVQVWILQGVVYANLRQIDHARAQWARALSVDLSASLPFAVSSKVRELFERVHAEVVAAKPEPPQPALQPDTPRAPVPIKTAVPMVSSTRFIISGVFLGLGVIASGVGVGFGVQANAAIEATRQASFADDKRSAYANAERSALITNASFITAGACALIAVLTYLFVP